MHDDDRVTYHESIGQKLDAVIAEGRGGELEIAEMAAEYLRRHGSDVVEQVNYDGRTGEAE